MVLSKKQEPITKEFIFSKIDSFDVYRRFIPDMQIGCAIKSPLRDDKNPSFLIKVSSTDNQLRHYDFAREEFHGNCIDFICQKYGLNYDKALQYLAKEFGLIDGTNSYKEIQSKYNKPVLDAKRSCLIQVSARPWRKEDVTYWGNYLIPIEICKKEEIYPVKELFVNRKKFPLKPNEIVYAYRRPKGFKIYMPERSKEEGKWLSNIPLSDVNHLENLSKDHNSLIIPSLKCYMVCLQIYPYLSQIQNESRGSITPEIVKQINENSKKVYYGGNNDVPGKEASYKITKEVGWYHVNPPDTQPKDWSDWSMKDQSLKGIEKHFKEKGLFL